jgi:hypothetical protein
MPRKVFTAGEVLAAADVNEFLMDQAVQSFAGTAARGSAIPSPVEGMVTYLEDIDDLRTYTGSSWVSPFALTHIKTQTIGNAVPSVVVSDVFSAAYDSYRVIVSDFDCSSDDSTILVTVNGTTGSNYNSTRLLINISTSGLTGAGSTAQTSAFLGITSTDKASFSFDVVNPF